MMELIKEVNIDGENFKLTPLPTFTALKLNNKILALIAPAFAAVKDFDLDAEINLGDILDALSISLMNLKDEDFVKFIVGMCSTVIYEPVGKQVMQMNESVIDKEFKGKLLTIYKLLFEIMKYNKLGPFGLWGDGEQTNLTGILQTLMQNKKEDGKQSEKLERSRGSSRTSGQSGT